MGTNPKFQTFDHGHQDLVLAADYNFYGDRLVTASSDHRLKVWDKKGDIWEAIDWWRAHDAEVTGVKWNGPFTGTVIGSIGEDGLCKLWAEDISHPPTSGRRFVLINKFASKSKLPWQSLDFKNIDTDTYLALITRDGRLSIMEPLDHDRLDKEWKDWFPSADDFNVCAPAATPARSDETGFIVKFHQEKLPCWTALEAGLDRKALSLAIGVMNTVKVYRTDAARRLYLAAELVGAKDLVRDLAWANGSMRGWDIIATASKDGAIRIYNLETRASMNLALPNSGSELGASTSGTGSAAQKRSGPPQASGIATGLAGYSRSNGAGSDEDTRLGRIMHDVVLDAELKDHHGAVWRVAFSYMGDLLTSTGDDGKVRTWKKGIDDRWLEYAEIEVKQQKNE